MFANIPDAVRSATRGWIGRFILAAMAAYATVLVLGVAWEPVRRVCLRRYHTDLPFPVWALLQPMPSMYSYDNIATYQSGDTVTFKQLNHHSYRVFGDFSTWWHAEHTGDAQMELRSRYLGTEVTTRFHLTMDEDHHVVVER
jgi:hypothetical protein